MKHIERYLFYLLLFLIPLQTRIILWQQSWYFNEWQSASIYATDILLLVLFLFWATSAVRAGQISKSKFLISKQNLKYQIQKPDFYLIIFLIISAVSIKNSSSAVLGAYNLIKLVEFA